MVLSPTLAARHIALLIPHCLQKLKLHQPLPKWMHLHLMEDHKDILWIMQRIDPFFKHIFKWLLSGKAPLHDIDTFMHIEGLLYKHVMDSNKKFWPPVIHKSWCFTVLVEANDKLGHRGINRSYDLIKCLYYWKGMNKDIHKYISNCALCKREKERTLVFPLQMTDIPNRPFDKITIDLNNLHQGINMY